MKLRYISETEGPPEAMIDRYLEGEENSSIQLISDKLMEMATEIRNKHTDWYKQFDQSFNWDRGEVNDLADGPVIPWNFHLHGSWFIRNAENTMWWKAYGLAQVAKQQFMGHRYDRVTENDMKSQIEGWCRHALRDIRGIMRKRKQWDSSDYRLAKNNLHPELVDHPLLNKGVDEIWNIILEMAEYIKHVIRLFNFYILGTRKRRP